MQTVAIPMESLVEIIRLQLSQGGKAPLTVTGGSMLPMLRDRKDKVILDPITAPLAKGALPLYRREDGAYILHRVIKVLGNGQYLCCGDNQWETEQVTAGQMVAVVTGFTRNGKHRCVTDRGYRLYVWLWTALHPVRRPILAVRRQLGRLRRALRRRSCKGEAL